MFPGYHSSNLTHSLTSLTLVTLNRNLLLPPLKILYSVSFGVVFTVSKDTIPRTRSRFSLYLDKFQNLFPPVPSENSKLSDNNESTSFM